MKVFIAQPMAGLSSDEILHDREEHIKTVKEKLGDDVEILDSFILDEESNPLKLLAKSIEILADADCAYFAPGWHYNRGCMIEHECAIKYGIKEIL